MERHLIDSFANLQNTDYFNVVRLNDVVNGISLYKRRDEDGFLSLFRVYIREEEYENGLNLKPLFITASYGKATENGITVASSQFRRDLSWPIEMTSTGDYFFDISSGQIYKNGVAISGINLLDEIDFKHMKPTRPFGGLYLRFKLFFWRTILPAIPVIFVDFLYVLSGKKMTRNLWKRIAEEHTTRNSTIIDESETSGGTLDIFGYRASQWSITFYASMHVIAYIVIVNYHYKNIFGNELFTNSFLSVLYVICSLGIFDKLIPSFLKYLIKKTTKLAVWASYKQISI